MYDFGKRNGISLFTVLTEANLSSWSQKIVGNMKHCSEITILKDLDFEMKLVFWNMYDLNVLSTAVCQNKFPKKSSKCNF